LRLLGFLSLLAVIQPAILMASPIVWEKEDVSRMSTQGTPSVYPQLAVDPAGNLHAIWRENTSTSPTLFLCYSMKPINGTWSVPEIISTYDEPVQSGAIVADKDGTVHVAWGTIASDNNKVYYRHKPPSQDWSEPINVRAGLGRNGTTGALLAVDQSGTVHVA
jgi:hypothetical protein